MTWTWQSEPEEESLLTVTLRPSNDGTELQLTHERFPNVEERDSHQRRLEWQPRAPRSVSGRAEMKV